VRSHGNISGRDQSHQKRHRSVRKVSGGRSPQIGPGRECSLGMVHCEGHRDPKEAAPIKEAAPMLQMPRAKRRTSHMRVHCGGSGHGARECPASAPRCPLCESLGVPANHRMAGTACTPPKTRRLARKRNILPRTSRHGKNTGMPCHRRRRQRTTPATAAVDGQGEAMELAQ
jgi:hypothetical protein